MKRDVLLVARTSYDAFPSKLKTPHLFLEVVIERSVLILFDSPINLFLFSISFNLIFFNFNLCELFDSSIIFI